METGKENLRENSAITERKSRRVYKSEISKGRVDYSTDAAAIFGDSKQKKNKTNKQIIWESDLPCIFPML